MSIPKVSIVVPCYNVEKYLRECLDSVVNQTLQEIEIICINDGSTDATLSILKEYADRDNRIRVIDKANSGYGCSMNLGFELAQGEYLGIVESDDFAEPTMFETLYKAASKNNLDVAKAGFYRYSTHPKVENVPIRVTAKLAGTHVFCPMTDFPKPAKQTAFFKSTAAIWAGIYRRDFIRENQIQFNTTPGASYQDTGFCFKVWAKAKRVQFLDDCLLHYRIDNEQSSVHDPRKVYCICDEFAEIQRFLNEDPQSSAVTNRILACVKYKTYLWNYERLSNTLQTAFLQRFYKEFQGHLADGILDKAYFSWYDWNNLQKLLLDPDRYHTITSQKLAGESVEDFYDAYPDLRPIRGNLLYYIVENLAGASDYLIEAGPSGVFHLFASKVKKRFTSCENEEKV